MHTYIHFCCALTLFFGGFSSATQIVPFPSVTSVYPTSGPRLGDTLVTIKGTNFYGSRNLRSDLNPETYTPNHERHKFFMVPEVFGQKIISLPLPLSLSPSLSLSLCSQNDLHVTLLNSATTSRWKQARPNQPQSIGDSSTKRFLIRSPRQRLVAAADSPGQGRRGLGGTATRKQFAPHPLQNALASHLSAFQTTETTIASRKSPLVSTTRPSPSSSSRPLELSRAERQ